MCLSLCATVKSELQKHTGKEHQSSMLERRYGPKELRRRLKLACGLAKMLYYIEVYLLPSPYFVTLVMPLVRTVKSGRFS